MRRMTAKISSARTSARKHGSTPALRPVGFLVGLIA